ncbi:hypothetical protein D3C72_2568350 [compost metagenome]
MGVLELARGAMHMTDALTDFPHSPFEQTLYVRAVASGVPLDHHVSGNSVADTVSNEFSAGNHS